MDRLPFPTGGVALASISAGPIFVSWVAFGFYLRAAPATVHLDESMLFMLPVMVLAMFFGFILAILPCAIGSKIMVSVSGNSLARTPTAWFVAGFILPFAACLLDTRDTDDGLFRFALAATGGVCALICRRGATAP